MHIYNIKQKYIGRTLQKDKNMPRKTAWWLLIWSGLGYYNGKSPAVTYSYLSAVILVAQCLLGSSSSLLALASLASLADVVTS